jgi:predicted nuclease with TOPRIM domain
MPPKAKADVELVTSVLRLAHMFRRSVADQAAAELADYKRQLRDIRAWLKDNAKAKPTLAEMKARHAIQLQGSINRLNRLRKQMASLRGEHPEARLPAFRDRTAECDAAIAATAARLQETVERAVWESLRAAERNNAVPERGGHDEHSDMAEG